MLPRKHAKVLSACLLMAAAWSAYAQTVRYHFGDDARWADAAFDDSSWPVAKDGAWPLPQLASGNRSVSRDGVTICGESIAACCTLAH